MRRITITRQIQELAGRGALSRPIWDLGLLVVVGALIWRCHCVSLPDRRCRLCGRRFVRRQSARTTIGRTREEKSFLRPKRRRRRRRVGLPAAACPSPPPLPLRPCTAHSASASPHRETSGCGQGEGGRQGGREGGGSFGPTSVAISQRFRGKQASLSILRTDLPLFCGNVPRSRSVFNMQTRPPRLQRILGQVLPRRVSDAHCGRGWPGRQRRRSTLSEERENGVQSM